MARLYWSLWRLSEPWRVSGEAYSGVAPPRRRADGSASAPGRRWTRPKSADLDVVADHEQVVRLDVEVLQAVLEIDHVEGLGRLAEEAEQLLARDAGLALPLAVEQDRLEVAVRQFHDENQHPVDDLDPFEGEEVGMADALDALDRFQFLGGERAAGVGVAADELDRLEEAAGRLALPDFAEAAAAERLEEPIPRDRLGPRLAEQAAPATAERSLPGGPRRKSFPGTRRAD